MGCPTDPPPDRGDAFNSGLTGTWSADFGNGYIDTYKITDSTVTEEGTGAMAHSTGSIEYVYNFSSIAGVIIVKFTTYTDDLSSVLPSYSLVGRYSAVYFNNLTATSVKLGTATDLSKNYMTESTDASVTTLEDAKERFKPTNINLWGGELTGAGPLTKQ
ncbi:hypothetical protein AGMMS49546_05400 [Spirochaetia bacterium]|nr:hypothetical protein AGMMS49546_05400 [Spirochaetia bacterium]